MKHKLPAMEKIRAQTIPLWAGFTVWFIVESGSVTTSAQFVLFCGDTHTKLHLLPQSIAILPLMGPQHSISLSPYISVSQSIHQHLALYEATTQLSFLYLILQPITVYLSLPLATPTLLLTSQWQIRLATRIPYKRRKNPDVRYSTNR
jgi:hypothetical protein